MIIPFSFKMTRLVLTDSGVPCVTIRENTERPITVELGTNVLAGTGKDGILSAYIESLEKAKLASVPALWDGKTSERIWEILLKWRNGE
jgi:UDP-N-acetylglucosamine 2-epimerase (non-hydrolysing)